MVLQKNTASMAEEEMPEAPGAAAAPASPAPGSTPGEVSHVSNTPRSARDGWSPQTAGNPSPSMTDDGRSVANTPGADSVYPTSPSYRSTPGSAAPRARAGGRWSTANPNGTMFTPEQRGAGVPLLTVRPAFSAGTGRTSGGSVHTRTPGPGGPGSLGPGGRDSGRPWIPAPRAHCFGSFGLPWAPLAP